MKSKNLQGFRKLLWEAPGFKEWQVLVLRSPTALGDFGGLSGGSSHRIDECPPPMQAEAWEANLGSAPKGPSPAKSTKVPLTLEPRPEDLQRTQPFGGNWTWAFPPPWILGPYDTVVIIAAHSLLVLSLSSHGRQGGQKPSTQGSGQEIFCTGHPRSSPMKCLLFAILSTSSSSFPAVVSFISW